MKNLYICIAITIVFSALSFSWCGLAGGQEEYSTSPPPRSAKVWRIGYLEGGDWKNYQSSLIATVETLAELGWIEAINIPVQKSNDDTATLWAWLAAHVRSDYLEFAADAYYSNNWDEEERKQTRQRLLKRLNDEQDIDLMLALGTWAGLDLANNEHHVPTLVASTTDPLRAGIIASSADSGYDHLLVRIDPTRHERQIRAFHDVIGFKKLGVVFQNTVEGRSYAAIEDIEKVAGERQFDIIPCYIGRSDTMEAVAEVIDCTRELAPRIDAYYAPMYHAINPNTLPELLAALNEYQIPTFSQSTDLVRYGLLLSVAQTNFEGMGKFYAATIAKIINGAKPRDLNQVHEAPVEIAFNAAAAILIGLQPEIYDLLLKTAEEVYEEIETK